MSSENSIEARIAALTPRERDVLEHLVHGRSNKLTGAALGISPVPLKFTAGG